MSAAEGCLDSDGVHIVNTTEMDRHQKIVVLACAAVLFVWLWLPLAVLSSPVWLPVLIGYWLLKWVHHVRAVHDLETVLPTALLATHPLGGCSS